MAKFYGWAGNILNVDLTDSKISKEELSLDFARKYIGANGFNSIKLFDLVKEDVDALSPENVIMFGAGPLVGTLAPCAARLTVTAKSPLTDIFADSNVGGFFGAEMKYAGYDQIVIFGKSSKPVYLWIDDDSVEIRDASHPWGKSAWEAVRMIKEEIGDPDVKLLCIGQAGENLVRFATIMGGLKRAAGRCGMGAVMGSKNLKAIAVRGTRDIMIAKPREFFEACKEALATLKSHPFFADLTTLGTPCFLEALLRWSAYGAKHFSTTTFEKAFDISGERFTKEFALGMRSCFSCPKGCTHFHNISSGEFAGVYGEGPEFGETQLGLRCDISDMPALVKMNQLFNQYGLDPISTQEIIAWAMDCYHRGILTKEHLDGLPLDWGDYKATIELIHKIARREGVGNILAEGEKRVARLAEGSEKFIYHVKGLAPVIEEPRAGPFGLRYYTGTRGADHLKGGVVYMEDLRQDQEGRKILKDPEDPEVLDLRSPRGTGAAVAWGEDRKAVIDAAGLCYFMARRIAENPYQQLAKLVSAATGIEVSYEELVEVGERIYNVEKAFNSREGLTRKDDNFSVPEKFTREPIDEGFFKGCVVELDLMLDDYYEARGWDPETGLQTRNKLQELKLEHIAAELEKVGAVR